MKTTKTGKVTAATLRVELISAIEDNRPIRVYYKSEPKDIGAKRLFELLAKVHSRRAYDYVKSTRCVRLSDDVSVYF